VVLINMPYMGVRIYLWTSFNADISVFLLKNIILTYVHLRSLIPEVREWIRNLRELRDSLLHGEERSFDGLPTSASSTPAEAGHRSGNDTTTIELNEPQQPSPPPANNVTSISSDEITKRSKK